MVPGFILSMQLAITFKLTKIMQRVETIVECSIDSFNFKLLLTRFDDNLDGTENPDERGAPVFRA